MQKYIPSATKWVADQVELYEASGGTEGTTIHGLPVVVVTNEGCKTGAIRKTPLMRVADGNDYILVASRGGAHSHPVWYYNLKANPNVDVQDGPAVYKVRAREINDPVERQRLWRIAVKAYPPYQDYQEKTSRQIPVFIAERRET